jgi:N-acyl-D-amino-acid deacylase
MKTFLKNGMIIDGSGDSSYPGSVIFENDRITDILPGEKNVDFDGNTIDCAGWAIAPGFIDAHSHNDWFAALEDPVPYFKTFAEQGVTTQVTGNCGFSPFGYEADTNYKSLIGGGLFEMDEGPGDYSTFAGWRGAAEKRVPLNIIPLQGHGTVRIGLSGYANRALSEKEISQCRVKIEESFDQGAAGLSFGLMYEPDRYAPPRELEEAAKITVKRGGILTVHARAFSASSTSYSPPVGGEPHNIRALKEMIELARKTGVKLQYSHLIFVGKSTWKTADKCLELIDRARSEGIDISYDLYSMTFGVSVITVVLPNWYLSLSREKRNAWGTKIRLAFETGLAKRSVGFDFEDIQVAWAGEEGKGISGKRISEIAAEWRVGELNAYLRVVEMSREKGRVNMYRYYNEDIILKLMRHEPSLFMTDAWIEKNGVQNAAAYSSFPKFLQIAREEKTIAMEKAVRKMSGAVAERFCISGRGTLKAGNYADITVFDPKRIGPRDSLPERPAGIEHVFVNGVHVVKQGLANESLLTGSGKILTR